MTSLEGDDRDESNIGRTDGSEFSMGSPYNISTTSSTSLQASTTVALTPAHSQLQQRHLFRSGNSWPTARHDDSLYDINNNPAERQRRQQADPFLQQQQSSPHAHEQPQQLDFPAQLSHGQYSAAAWPPRSYSCNFCRRDFNSAQALGGHMNVHRRDRARLRHSSGCSSPAQPASVAAHFEYNYSTPAAAVSSTSPCNDTAASALNVEATNIYGRIRDEPQPHTMVMPIDRGPWSIEVAAATANSMVSSGSALIPFVVGTPANLIEGGYSDGNTTSTTSSTSVATSLTFLRSAGTSAFGSGHSTMNSNDPDAYDHSGSGQSTRDARSHSLSSRVHGSASGSSGSTTGVLDLELRLGRRSSVDLNDVDKGEK